MAEKVTDDTLNEFEYQRKKAGQENAAAVQGQKDALKRRFAAAGALNSGAAIKQDQLVEDAGQNRLNQVNEGINAAQTQENQRRREVAEGRQYATSERLGSQDFAAGQAAAGRQFATGERLGGQEFSRSFGLEQLAKQQKFASDEAGAGRDFQNALTTKERDIRAQQFAEQMALANKQFVLDKETTEFNTRIAQGEADKPDRGWLGTTINDIKKLSFG